MAKQTKQPRNQKQLDQIKELKAEYLRFFAKFPVQQAAADFIGRTPAAIQEWQKADPEFFAAVSRAKAEWAEKNSRRVRPDNLLARLYEDMKPPKQEIEQSGETKVVITYVHPHHPTGANPEAGPDLAEAPGSDNN